MKFKQKRVFSFMLVLILAASVFAPQILATETTDIDAPEKTEAVEEGYEESNLIPEEDKVAESEIATTPLETEGVTEVTEPEAVGYAEDTITGGLGQGKETTTLTINFILVGTSLNPVAGVNPYQVWLETEYEVTAGATAWDLTEDILKAKGYSYTDYNGSCHLQKLTPPASAVGQHELEASVTNGLNSSWMWSYNDNIDKSANEYIVEDQDTIRWYFTNDWQQKYYGHPDRYVALTPNNDIDIQPDAVRPTGLSSWWSAFGGAMDHNASKELKIKLDGFTAEEVFHIQKKEGSWMDSFSDPIQVGDWIYVVFSDSLYKLNRDGSINSEAKLQYRIDSTSRLAYADGLILVPMQLGKIQALTADSLTTVWISDAMPQLLIANDGKDIISTNEQQSLSSLKVKDGIIYQSSCTVGWSPRSYGGTFRALEISDGSVLWERNSVETGHYWTGAAILNSVAIIGNDMGEVFSISLDNGLLVDKFQLPPVAADGMRPAIRTNMIAYDNQIFFVSQQDGTLHRLGLNADGRFGTLESVKFAGSSTVSPTILDGKVYVAGFETVAIIDAESMKIDKSYDIDGVIQGTPLVVKDKAAKIFVYFTINNQPGAIYGLSSDEDDVHTIYMPPEDLQNWCMASVSISEDGTLYYSNDSKTFFAVKLKTLVEEIVPDETVPETTIKPTEKTTLPTEITSETVTDKTVTDKSDLPATGERSAQMISLLAITFFIVAALSFVLLYKRSAQQDD